MKYTTQWNETIGAYEVVRRSDGAVVQTNIMTGGKAEVARWIWEKKGGTEVKRIVKDLSEHFKDKLHTLIVDTIDTCDYADMDGHETACIILDGLLFEVVVGSAVINLSEQQFMETCLLAHKIGGRAFTERDRKRKRPAQGG